MTWFGLMKFIFKKNVTHEKNPYLNPQKKKNISIKKKHTYTNTLEKNKFHFLGTTINTNG